MTTDDRVVDLVVVGGGPAGLATALRARELGVDVRLLEVDDLMRRIRDYSKDKLILPGFGGGDRMTFPAGGRFIERLPFEPIDKDELCERWRGLLAEAGVEVCLGHELTGLRDDEGAFRLLVYDHRERREAVHRARHVALAIGRGVPRHFEIPGDTGGIALRLEDPQRYVGAPACVIGGGTAAAEAVIALSHAKAAAGEATVVHWSYRGDKLPRVSKALADAFFEAYAGNGNVRYHPLSEPVMVALGEDRRPYLAIRVDRRRIPGRAVETSLLELPVEACIACIGEDVPEELLAALGTPLVVGGARQRRRPLVAARLEGVRRNVFLLGDVLSQAHFRCADFAADPASYDEVRHRGNIKSAVHDGVLVAQVVAQRLAGVADADLDLDTGGGEVSAVLDPAAERSGFFAPRPVPATGPPQPADEPVAWLVRLVASGAESEEHPLGHGAVVTLGRQSCDLTFPEDVLLSEHHASIVVADDGIVLRDDGSTNGVFLQVPSDRKLPLAAGDLLRAGRQFLLVDGDGPTPALVHYDAGGAERRRFRVESQALVLGRDLLDPSDTSLSRRHLALSVEHGRLQVKDLLSANGTFLRVLDSTRLEPGDRFLAGQQRFALTAHPDAVLDPGPQRSAPPPAAKAVASAEGTATVTFRPSGKTCPVARGQTLLEVAEANGIPIAAECRAGVCGSDPLRILAGRENLVAPPDRGESETLEDLCGLEPGPCRLACKARITGPVEVEVLGR